MAELAVLGIVRSIAARHGNLYLYAEYLGILGERAEPIQ